MSFSDPALQESVIAALTSSKDPSAVFIIKELAQIRGNKMKIIAILKDICDYNVSLAPRLALALVQGSEAKRAKISPLELDQLKREHLLKFGTLNEFHCDFEMSR